MLSPGETPCYLLLTGIKVPRVIGKRGILINELRQESGATIDLLDRPPAIPEALQQSEVRVARVRGTDAASHVALTGLIRNAIGPDSMREFDGELDQESGVLLLVHEKVVPYLGDSVLLDGTDCALNTSAIAGVRRHHRVQIKGLSTKDLQVVAWRVHEVVLRMARNGQLFDRDFDLQDTAWEAVMDKFKKRQEPAEVTASPGSAIPTQSIASLGQLGTSPVASALELEARTLHEAREREAQERKERERKARAREVQVQEASERAVNAWEYHRLTERSRDAWARAAQTQDPFERRSLEEEAQIHAAQAREAHERSLTKAKGVSAEGTDLDPQQQQQHGADSATLSVDVPEQSSLSVAASVDAETQQAHLRQAVERREREAREAAERREREATERALEIQARDRDMVELRERENREAAERRRRDAEERQAAEHRRREAEERHAHKQHVREADAQRHCQHLQAQTSSKAAELLSMCCPDAVAATNASCNWPPLSVRTPNAHVAAFLASPELGIGRRSGTKVSWEQLGPGCMPVLRIDGPPASGAIACYLVQEALFMQGAYR
mmetsp:Transcript_79365/g.157245  ORF Transcript_79365/g.157245 Transcript_79365/m.157245 type:complete len:559 (-) Transcript_79365:246-1922(-)